MRKLLYIASGILMSFFVMSIQAQEITQNIRGQIIDSDSKQNLIGVTLYIQDSNPLIGVITDPDGHFMFEDLPIGRYNIVVNYLGYESRVIPNVMVGSGKEAFVNVELSESLTRLEAVVVTANKNKGEALNDMATVSARSFTVEETKRYAGTFNDPARMVSSYAGVISDPSGENDIIVRGNSPKGILWRLDGIEIPNPNHFANEGYSGGPINALNSAMLDNSDFFTGAFTAEYGNAYSGVFDMKLRKGNSEKREYSLSAGALGFDGTAEGPIKAGYGGSYLVNYRYSSLAVLDDLNLVDFYGVPKYQDLSFKLFLPAGNAGTFTLFGLGGKSSIYQQDFDKDDEEYVTDAGDFGADLGVVGLSHMVPINAKTYVKTTLSGSGTENSSWYETRNNTGEMYIAGSDKFINTSLRASTCINYKFNAQHRLKGGLTYTKMGYKMFAEWEQDEDEVLVREIDSKGNTGLVQAYVNWKYRATEQLTFIAGAHYLYFQYNNNYAFEPRFGMKYQLNEKGAFNFGLGLHSKVESLATYNAQIEDEEGQLVYPNKDLGMNKAAHIVGGYQHHLNKDLRFNVELYYQHLYDVPVEDDPESSYVYNNESGGWTNLYLTNQGTGHNYGAELTLERFYNKGFYYLATASFYDSKFTALDEVERNSSYNGKFASNFLLGKEFSLGDKSKNRILGLNAKVTYYGGQYYTPIDLDASIEEGRAVYESNNYNGVKFDNVFKADFAISYRRDRRNTTHELKIDIQNITNSQSTIGNYFDRDEGEIVEYYQWSIFPNVIYTISF